jgi:Holliday junction resolvase RusA-like endonuclease
LNSKIEIVINGKPHPKQRPRFANGRAYSPKSNTINTKDIQQQFIVQKKSNDILTGALYARVCYYLPKPKGKLRVNSNPFPYATSKPDLDNLLKQTLDALNGLAYEDDSQIVSVATSKLWAEPNRERTEVTIGEIGVSNWDDIIDGNKRMFQQVISEGL